MCYWYLLFTEITCDPSRTAPTNGRVSCTDTNHYDSVCTYTCNEGYALSNENLETTTCIGDGQWSSVPPQCIGMLFIKKI